MGNYGLPYMGSKNKIAHIIIDLLPKAENFYDLFCGGCSITHVAILSRKYKNIYFNDIDGDMPQLFLDAIRGKYKEEKRWISREDFEREKKNSAYIRIVWSFGNKGTNYLYSKEIEPYKKAYWYAIFHNDFSLFRKLGINIPNINAKTYKEKRLKISKWLKEQKIKGGYRQQALERLERLQSLQSLEALERLERLQSLQSLEALERLQSLQSLEALERLQSLHLSKKSYDEVEIKDNSVIYCDIPYEKTAGYVSGDFDHKKFYDWACSQKELVVISSYEISDKRFKRVVNLKKNSNLQGGFGNIKNEGLFIPINQENLWKEMRNKND